jgi:hypothetical protein
MTKAIGHAGMGMGWEMAATTPDHIIGTLNLRAHQALSILPTTLSRILFATRAVWAYCTARQIKPQDKKLVKFTKTTMAG